MNFKKVIEEKEKRILHIMAGVFLSVTVLIFLFKDSRLNYPIYFSVVPMLIFSVLTLLKKINLKFVFNLKKIDIILCVVLSILFLLMLSILEILKADIFSFKTLKLEFNVFWAVLMSMFLYLVYLPSVLLCTFLLLCKLFSLQGVKAEDKPAGDMDRKVRLKDYYKFLIPIAIISLVYMFACYPGYMSNDSLWNWKDIHANVFSDWHAIGYVIFIKVASLIWDNYFFVIIIQTLIWIFANYMAVKLLYELFGSKKILIVYTLVTCLFLNQFLYLIIYFKDVLFFTLFYCYFISFFRCCAIKKAKLLDYVKMAIFGGLVSLVRHMSIIYIILPIIVFLVKALIGKNWINARRLGISAGIVLATFLVIVYGVGFGILKAEKNGAFVKYTTPISMIGAVVASGVELDEEDIKIIESIMPLERWAECYNKYWGDDLARYWGKIGSDLENYEGKGSDIIKLNAKFFFKYPKIYTTAIFDMSSIVWEIGRPSDGFEWPLLEMDSLGCVDKSMQIRPNGLTRIVNPICEMLYDNPITASMWRGGFPLFMLITSFTILLRKKRYKESIILTSVLVSALMFFFSIPAQDPRYIIHFISTAIFSCLYAVGICHNKSKAKLPAEEENTLEKSDACFGEGRI